MAKINGQMDNSRGSTQSVSEPTFALIQGWHAGVETRLVTGASEEAFNVFMTSGANGGNRILLGVVTQTPEGPKFSPAEIPQDFLL